MRTYLKVGMHIQVYPLHTKGNGYEPDKMICGFLKSIDDIGIVVADCDDENDVRGYTWHNVGEILVIQQ